jgi:hypothetical protein
MVRLTGNYQCHSHRQRKSASVPSKPNFSHDGHQSEDKWQGLCLNISFAEAREPGQAISTVNGNPEAKFLAGGTTLIE